MSDIPWIPARPTLYKGIRMRSRLEANFAEFLDGRGDEWAYEPECFAGDGGQWLPDFGLMPARGKHALYVEVKPAGFLQAWGDECHARVTAIMRQMEIARQTDPKCNLWLWFWSYSEDEHSTLMACLAGETSWRVTSPAIHNSVGLLWPEEPLR